MCLSTLKKAYPKKIKDGFGYKVFRKENGCLIADLRNDKPCCVNVWLKEGDFRTSLHKNRRWVHDAEVKYLYGFHIFFHRQGAINWCGNHQEQKRVIKKVQYRKAIAIGSQGFREFKVVVAKEMKILEDK